MLNSTSAGYLSPTIIKGFLGCPANYVYEKTLPYTPRQRRDVLPHDLGEVLQSLNPEDQNERRLAHLRDEIIRENGQAKERPLIQRDLDGYFEAGDYLTGKTMDHRVLKCEMEKFFKPHLCHLGIAFSKAA